MSTPSPLDQQKKKAFAQKLVDILNGGSLALMVSIGHRTGLFDTMSGMSHATSHQLAETAGLNERYVREWLGAMVAGGIVEVEAKGSAPRYRLPGEHAASLIRKAGADNGAVFAQYIALMGSVEDQIVECFTHGGGVPYSEFERFHEVMAEDSDQSIVSSLLETVLPLVPGLIQQLEAGIGVLDVGCGRGRAINLMAKAYPRSTFTGYDLSEEAVASGNAQALANGCTNIHFEARDLTHFASEAPQDSFDLITAFDAVHDQARPDRLLAGVCKALVPGGTFFMQDIAASSQVEKNINHPAGPFLYAISTMHCMTVSLAQGGMGLGAVWGEEKALEMLAEAGFVDTEIKSLPHDSHNNFYISSKRSKRRRYLP